MARAAARAANRDKNAFDPSQFKGEKKEPAARQRRQQEAEAARAAAVAAASPAPGGGAACGGAPSGPGAARAAPAAGLAADPGAQPAAAPEASAAPATAAPLEAAPLRPPNLETMEDDDLQQRRVQHEQHLGSWQAVRHMGATVKHVEDSIFDAGPDLGPDVIENLASLKKRSIEAAS